ncbi:MAG: oligosaccharide flippase family protein, partial [Candidatus Hermodarchaeota archaeon]
AISETTNQIDIILIGFYLMSIDLGYYAASISISKFFWLIPLSIQKITYPITSEHWKKNNHQSLHRVLDKSMKYSTILLVLSGLSTFFLSKDIIFFLFNEEYIYSVLPLQILLISTVIRGSITQPIGGSLAGIGRPDLLLKIILIVTFSNFFFGVLLIPQYGIVGAAMSTSISLIIGSIINLILVIKYLSFPFDLQWFIRMSCIVFLAIIIFQFGILFFNRFMVTGIILLCCVLLIYVFLLAPNDIRFFKSMIYSVLKQKSK